MNIQKKIFETQNDIIFKKTLKIFIQMFDVLIQKCRKKYNIICVNFDKFTKVFQHKIDLFLHICERIFKFHYCHVKLLLISMNNDRLFITIFFDDSLIKILLNIDNWNVTAFCHDCDYVNLWRHEICVCLYYLIQFTNIYYHAFFFSDLSSFIIVFQITKIEYSKEMNRENHFIFFCSWSLSKVSFMNFWFFIFTE